MAVMSPNTTPPQRNGHDVIPPRAWESEDRHGRHRVEQQQWENSPRRLVIHTSVFTGRVLRRWGRDVATMVESLVMPVVLLVTLDIVLGDNIKLVTGESALYGSVPLIAMVGAMTGAMVTGISLMRERTDGVLSRFWVLPVHRAAGLLSRLIADALRITVTTGVVLGVGVAMGFRFRQGVWAALAWVGIPTLLGLAFTAAVLTLSLYAANTVMVELSEGVWAVLMFFSTGFVPLDQYPDWIRPVVQHQPVSCAIEAMRGLSLGGPVLQPFLEVLAWSAGIMLACLLPLAIGYRRASKRG
jgi:ABC-2 type transport system permease protein